ncbi:MAG: SDR family NAD(P)-dependent oxidoreductase [Candidatus Parcubacteria bacterium]|nr:SDR family NAD(P)-dependent oxidoreductase [Candidatus Parcubacteria bacterium]
MFNLNGKVAIITGARRGMGRTHSMLLAQAGAKVVVSDIDLKECEQVVEEIKNADGEAMAIKCDVTNKKDIDQMVKRTIDEFGKIDILVNNAGICQFKPFVDLTDEDWEKTININLRGYYWCAKAVVPGMIKQKSGRIINIASIAAGQIGVGFAGLTHYGASKGGIVAFTESLALELAPYNITVNAIAPGAIDTPMAAASKTDSKVLEASMARIPLRRMGKPEEISSLVVFLASDEASYITGDMIVADGGYVST